jgi:hypothetical protein
VSGFPELNTRAKVLASPIYAGAAEQKSLFIQAGPWFRVATTVNVRTKTMNTPILTPGMKIVHPNHGEGVVEKVSTGSAEIRFGNILRTIDPRLADIKVPEPMVKVGEVEVPLKTFVQGIVESTVNELGIEQPDASVSELGPRWIKGKLVMHPSDPTLQTKEVPLETFFHKIVMVRNQLRVLEQKINAHGKLDDAEKVEMQQYITRCYGSLTTFNILFKEKEDQF